MSLETPTLVIVLAQTETLSVTRALLTACIPTPETSGLTWKVFCRKPRLVVACNIELLCLQKKITIRVCHIPPLQKWLAQLREVLGVFCLNHPWKGLKQTRWRRPWRVLFARTYCMTVSGKITWTLSFKQMSKLRGFHVFMFNSAMQIYFWASCLCFSLQPCMHVFCAACYSGWMERSSLCPTCRCPVERIHKNHILNNLVEAYLIQHPGLCR